MKIDDLKKNWMKGKSLEFLSEAGFNTPNFIIVENLSQFNEAWGSILVSSKFNRMSVRSYLPYQTLTKFKFPAFPNHLISSEFTETLIALIRDKGLHLILADPIDPAETLFCGNMAIRNQSWLIEYRGGAGIVRDLDSASDIKIIKGEFHKNYAQVKSELGMDVFFLLRALILNLYWGEDIIIEWSLYPHGIGRKNQPIITWELRPFSHS